LSESRQLIRNTTWSLLDIGLYPLLMLLATPVFIIHLGLEQYGIWMIATTVNLYITILHFGVADTTIRAIAALRAKNNTDAIRQTVNQNWSFTLKTCVLALIIGGIISFSGLIQLIFHIRAEEYSLSMYITFISFATSAIKFLELFLLSIFKAHERFDRSALLSLISRNSSILSALLIVLCGGSLMLIFVTLFVISILNILLQVILVKSHFKYLSFAPHWKTPFRLEKEIQRWYWLQSCIGSFGFLSDRIIVGYFTDVKTTGLYATATLIGSQLHNALSAIGGFLFPKIAYKNENNSDLRSLYSNSSAIIGGLGWLGIYMLLLLSPIIFKLWLGEVAYLLSHSYIHLYLIYIVFMTAVIVPFQFINASYLLKFNTWFELRLRITHILFMLFGVIIGGVNGLLWGLIIATCFNILCYYYFFFRHFFESKSIIDTLKRLVPPLTFIPFVLSENIIFQITMFLLFVITYYFIYFKPSKLRFWKK
jgi:O-antigen/teichoic acid export membrane protein